MDNGFVVAMYFFSLGILWLFIAAFILGILGALRKLVG